MRSGRSRRGGPKNTHYGRRQHGLNNNGGQALENSIPPCCKMWLPCTETAGATYIDDVVGGVRVTPHYIGFGEPGAVTLNHNIAAPTAGTIPTPDLSKDFIFMSVYRFQAWIWSLLEGNMELGNRSVGGNDHIALADADAFTIGTGSSAIVASDTWGRSNVDRGRQGQAIVRKGGVVSLWQKCLDGTGVTQGNTPNYKDGSEVYSIYRKIDNDPNFFPFCELPDGFKPEDIADPEADIPGLWRCCPDLSGITLSNHIRIGSYDVTETQPANVGAPHLFGMALFVFENGIPSDWLESLNWMHDQWLLNNKVIYPGWVTLE